MLSFNKFVKLESVMAYPLVVEDMVNYNFVNQAWQVRNDNQAFKYEDKKVVLRNAKPHVDHEAHHQGKKVYAYIKGDIERKPDLSKHEKREVRFNKGSLDKPFIHTDDSSKMHHADYVEFHGNKVHAYYKR